MLADSGSRVLVHGPECAELAAAADPAEHGVAHVLPAADLRPARMPEAAAGSPSADHRRQTRSSSTTRC